VKERDDLEDVGADESMMLKRILKERDRRELSGFIWLRIRTSGRLL
jgi:hypothetical protein